MEKKSITVRGADRLKMPDGSEITSADARNVRSLVATTEYANAGTGKKPEGAKDHRDRKGAGQIRENRPIVGDKGIAAGCPTLAFRGRGRKDCLL